MIPNENDLIRQSSAARLRGVSPAAIADLISRGRLKIYNVAGVPFVSRREVMNLERQTPGPKPGGKKKAKR
jgi:hypothetical protein